MTFHKVIDGDVQDVRAPTLFVVVPELPRGALVEKQVLVHTGQCDIEDDDGTLVRRNVEPFHEQGRILFIHNGHPTVRCEQLSCRSGREARQ